MGSRNSGYRYCTVKNGSVAQPFLAGGSRTPVLVASASAFDFEIFKKIKFSHFFFFKPKKQNLLKGEAVKSREIRE